MNLHEKILYCRKKAGLSQEELSEKIGVSRQAISKWETGDSVPELGKIVLLADIFQVTTDWLLKDDETLTLNKDKEVKDTQGDWVQSIPGVLGKLIRRYGWLIGVYVAISGALFTGMGIVGKLMFNAMFKNSPFSNETVFFDSQGFSVNDPFGFSIGSGSNPASIFTTFIIIVGVISLIGGIVLAIVLKSKGAERHNS